MDRDYYCQQKFDWLEIRLYDGFVASCCRATPDKLTTELLLSDPQGFFNWPKLLVERQQMLDNKRVEGCDSCWYQEDQGLPSRRTITKSHTRYQNLRHLPKTLNLVINNTCNLTCSYCCKNFSHSWRADVVKNGDYSIDGYEDRYNSNNSDKIVHRISQQNLNQSKISLILQDQLNNNISHIEKVLISGGEPLIHKGIEEFLEKFNHCDITITTGLGLPTGRLQKIINVIKDYRVKFDVSAENIGSLYEFNRYGNTYENFLTNLKLIRSYFPIKIISTISNLTAFGFADFYKHTDLPIIINPVTDPGFFHISVLDDQSKQNIGQLLHGTHPESQNLIKAMSRDYDDKDRLRLSQFLTRFIKNRKLTLDIYPKNFVQWLYRD